MKAVVFDRYGPPEVLHPAELPVPEPGPREVRVKVRDTTVNPMDWKVRRGRLRFVMPRRFPWVPGFDIAGDVDAVGRRVTGLKPGDPVLGYSNPFRNGAAAEFAVTKASYLVPKPPDLSYEEAVGLPGSGVAALWMVRDLGRVRAGQRVLVIGASGGVGHFCVQIARALGADVDGVCSSANADLVRGLGADRVFPYDRQEVPAEARYEAIFDTVKAARFFRVARHLTRRGRYVSTLPDFAGLVLAPLMWPFGFRKRCLMVNAMPNRRRLQAVVDLAAAGKVRAVIDHVYSLEQLAEAHRRSETRHAHGKIVVRVAA